MSECWWVDRAQRRALEDRAPLDVAAWMQPAEDREILSTDRQSAAVHWHRGGPLLVKWRRPIRGRRHRTFFRPSRERREARAMLRARGIGIPCPEPWAVGERRRRGVLLGAVLVRAFDPNARSAADALREDRGAVRAVALALRSWHDLGFRHGDCYPKNVLVGPELGAPRPIGCPKAVFRKTGVHLDTPRLKDLAQLGAGCAALLPFGDPFAFLTAYGESPGLPGYDDLLARIQPFYERILERKAERERTRPLREPAGPPAPVPLERGAQPHVSVRALLA